MAIKPGKDNPDTHEAIAEIEQQYRTGVAFKQAAGYLSEWPEIERVWRGKLWPRSTPKEFPQPSNNFMFQIISQKVAAAAAEATRIFFIPAEGVPDEDATMAPVEALDQQAAPLLNDLTNFTWDRVEQDEILDDALHAAAMFGSGFAEYWWDNTLSGGSQKRGTLWKGDLQGAEIDPLNLFPGNFYDPKLQRQPFLIIAEPMDLEATRRFYRQFAGNAVERLQPQKDFQDTEAYQDQHIPIPGERCLVIRRLRKVYEDGKPVRLELLVTCQGMLLRYEPEYLWTKPGVKVLYPVVKFDWHRARKRFFAVGDGEQILPDHKEMNRMAAMIMLSAYTTAMPQKRYRVGMLDPHLWTNKPGLLLPDKGAPGTGWSMDYLQPPQMPAYPREMWEAMKRDLPRRMGTTEAFVGEAPSAELNASAILQLQQAAGVRMRPLVGRIRRGVRDTALLWLNFWKEFYDERRLVRVVGEDGRVAFRWFRNTMIQDMEFDVRVTAGPGSVFAMGVYVDLLSRALEQRHITFDEYLDLLPGDVFPFAERLRQRRAGTMTTASPPSPEPPSPEALAQLSDQELMGQLGAMLGGQTPG